MFSPTARGNADLHSSSRPLTFDFWFDESFGEIRFVSTTSGAVIHGSAEPNTGATPPQGSCQPSSSLSVLVTGMNVVSYVPKGNWGGGATGVSVVNVEGTGSLKHTLVPTATVVNSCASNPISGQTVCTGNDNKVYVFKGAALDSTIGANPLTSGGTGTINFSGGTCTNCGVAMDAVHNRAVIALSTGTSGVGGFQFLDLSTPTPTFGSVFASQAPSGSFANISEDVLVDPNPNLLLSPSELNNYEIINLTGATPAFFENGSIGTGGALDSAAQDCSTGIILAPAEFEPIPCLHRGLNASHVFRWLTRNMDCTLNATNAVGVLSFRGASGLAVAQGTHIGIVAGEFGGSAITAIKLPATSGQRCAEDRGLGNLQHS